MKTLYLIGGTMGVGKTTVSQQLKQDLPNSVFLDGDWCWDASPFQVTEETKAMVTDNICYLLNSFLHCSAYENHGVPVLSRRRGPHQAARAALRKAGLCGDGRLCPAGGGHDRDAKTGTVRDELPKGFSHREKLSAKAD